MGRDRFLPQETDLRDIKVNVERYLYALQFCPNKVVVDAGCGAGLGTYLYSLLAKKVIAVDNSKEAYNLLKQYPLKDNVEFRQLDLEKEPAPSGDVCVALEFIEHLYNPEYFLSNLKCPELVYSIPMHSLAVSKSHKYDFQDQKDIRDFINKYYIIQADTVQEKIWVVGHAIKKPL